VVVNWQPGFDCPFFVARDFDATGDLCGFQVRDDEQCAERVDAPRMLDFVGRQQDRASVPNRAFDLDAHNGESQLLKLASDGLIAARELGRSKRSLLGVLIAEGRAGDCLGVVAISRPLDEEGLSRGEAVTCQEGVPADLVERIQCLGDGVRIGEASKCPRQGLMGIGYLVVLSARGLEDCGPLLRHHAKDGATGGPAHPQILQDHARRPFEPEREVRRTDVTNADVIRDGLTIGRIDPVRRSSGHRRRIGEDLAERDHAAEWVVSFGLPDQLPVASRDITTTRRPRVDLQVAHGVFDPVDGRDGEECPVMLLTL
jgi:hypothetical protein